MRKRSLLFYLLIVVILTGCGQNTIDFSGEGENWSAEMKVTHHGEDWQEEEYLLQYRGDADSVDQFEYKWEAVGSSSGTGATLNEHGVWRGDGSCGGCAFTREDTEVTVTVEWGDQVETFGLEVE
ncbi:hypothetical protein [Lentibacillus sediminis]|uniref:hypothetical protein n=1 Tax=Lentibacillus sediminis TaxID=1940529 RepID=UPI000C1BB3EA|nr:hypothetical protein [Lentibacillus sediminis]